jgi:hypothetical protein
LVQSSPRPDQPIGERLQQDLKNDLIAGLLVAVMAVNLLAMLFARPILRVIQPR